MSTSHRMNGIGTSPSVPSCSMDQYSLGPKPSPGSRVCTDMTWTLSPAGYGRPLRMPWASALDRASPLSRRPVSIGGSSRIHDCSTTERPRGSYLNVILSERKTRSFLVDSGTATSGASRLGEISVTVPPSFSSQDMQQSFLRCRKLMCSSTLPSSTSSSVSGSGLSACSSLALAKLVQSIPLVRSPKWKSMASQVRGAQAAARFVRFRSKRETASPLRLSRLSGSGISVSRKAVLPFPPRPR
mmetsp:Transcript_22748/g.65592  ORF Transcript_22748/g.65592 Transcript_22748/m.65592 type:complete len:243 (+) Transcript_22748:2789-3517(+)